MDWTVDMLKFDSNTIDGCQASPLPKPFLALMNPSVANVCLLARITQTSMGGRENLYILYYICNSYFDLFCP